MKRKQSQTRAHARAIALPASGRPGATALLMYLLLALPAVVIASQIVARLSGS